MTNAQLDSLKVGSIVRRPRVKGPRACPYRVVRRVGKKWNGQRYENYWFEFTAQGHAAYSATILLDRTKMKEYGYVGTGARMRLKSRMDRRLAKLIAAPKWDKRVRRSVKISEVIGLVY